MSTFDSIEIWRQVPGYGLHYEASNFGRIRVKDRAIIKMHPMTGMMTEYKYKSKVLKPTKKDKWGHLGVTLGVDGTNYSVSVHKLVLLAFHGEKPHGMEACHNNGIASDNSISNLRWDTHLANNRDRVLHGTYLLGEVHKMAKLTEVQAISIRESTLPAKELMDFYSISRSQICRIRRGKAWPYLAMTIAALNT